MANSDVRTIYKLLKEQGWTLTLRKVTVGAYVPGVGITSTTTEDHDFTGVMLSVREDQIDGSTVLESDQQCVMSSVGLDETPEIKDVIVDDDDTVYTIYQVKKIRQGGNVIAYICKVRV